MEPDTYDTPIVHRPAFVIRGICVLVQNTQGASILTFVEHIDSRKQYAVTWADL